MEMSKLDLRGWLGRAGGDASRQVVVAGCGSRPGGNWYVVPLFGLCLAAGVWVLVGLMGANPRPAGWVSPSVKREPSVVGESHPPTQTPRPVAREAVAFLAEDKTETKDAAVASDPIRPAVAKGKGHAKAKGGLAGADLFDNSSVPKIQITISRADMETLRGGSGRWGFRQPRERPSVKATVREGGVVYTNVAIHLKGAAGSFRSVDDDPCLTLNFEKNAPGQTFHGLRKLSLNNSVQDPSYLTEKICRELFEASGVPVGRAGHAMVTLNGQKLGLRVLVEGLGKQFLKRYFKNTAGNLYDGGFIQDITGRLQVISGDDPQDNSGLRTLIAAAREANPALRMAKLEQALDMDRFLSFIAMDVMQCDWDGYAMKMNNWRIFHDLGAKRMVFIPHGLDQMFGVERTSPDCPILPYMEGMVAQAVVSTPDGRRRYLERMAQLHTNVFKVDAILKRVDETAALIRRAVAQDSAPAARQLDEEVRWLKERIAQRDESLRRQLAAVFAPLNMGTNGVVLLRGWKSRVQTGSPEFRLVPGDGNNPLLYIAAAHGDTVGSWRTRVTLEPGIYRFEGRIRTQGVTAGSGEAGTGAGLRTSGGNVREEVTGSQEWQRVVYPFQVTEAGSEVQLICELRAARGEAWFEGASLRVVRLR